MSQLVEQFVDRAERYSVDRNRLRGDGEAVARRILSLAERVDKLDDRLFYTESRESAMARIWAAYQVVTDYLDSGAPYNLDSPEVPWSEYGESLGELASDVDWDGNPEQVLVDNQYEGYD